MFQRLFLTVCILLNVAALNGKQLHKKYNFVLNDGACEDGKVKCQNSDRCIPQRWICDGDNDCGDYFDETNCPPVTCSYGRAKCPTANRCIPSDSFCDGVNDCGDNSDESEECRSRTCPEGQLKCKSGQCIDSNAYCTGSDRCRDATYFTDITCPYIACDGEYVKCAVKTKCIPISFVCDGDNDCGDLTDEPENCRSRFCESDFFKCNNGQCLNQTALCLFISSYSCRDDTDPSSICADFTCPTGYTKCISDGKCTANTNLCDGSSDCADGSDEAPHHCTGPQQCTQPGTVPCPRTRRCINSRDFCDTDNDCGDNSDEDASFCSTRTCQPNEVRCGNGQCLEKDSYCDGLYNCRVGLLADNGTICSSEVYAGSSSDSDTQTPSAEELTCLMSLISISQCGDTPFPELTVDPKNERAVWYQLIEMDFRVMCGSIRTWFECYQSALSACANVDNPMLTDIKQIVTIGELAINYVCGQHIEVFGRNKACLLEGTESGPDSSTSEIKLVNSVMMCATGFEPIETQMCIPNHIHRCAMNAVAAQCGDEIAGVLSGLADLLQSAAGCPTAKLRALPYTQEQRRAVRELGSGNQEEFTCVMALLSIRDTCVPYSFRDSDPKAIYQQLVESDIEDLCGLARGIYECSKYQFGSCTNVNNPLVDDMKRMLTVVDAMLNYVCIEHANVINRNKACLLREANAGLPGSAPLPEIVLAVMPCAQLAQPESVGSGNPLCVNNPAAERCVSNAIAAQCGQEIANTIDGLNDVVRAAANCPARRIVAMKSLKTALKKRRGFFHPKD